jgi:hypothetical protein
VSYCTPFSLDRVANMETIKFLQSALGDEGFYCVFAVRKTDDRRVQKFYPNLDQVVHTVALVRVLPIRKPRTKRCVLSAKIINYRAHFL